MTPEKALEAVKMAVINRPRKDARKPLYVSWDIYSYAEAALNDQLRAQKMVMLSNRDLPLPNFMAFGVWIVRGAPPEG